MFPGAPYDESDKIRSLTGVLGVRAQAIQPAPIGALWLALRYIQEWEVPLAAPGALLDMTVVQAPEPMAPTSCLTGRRATKSSGSRRSCWRTGWPTGACWGRAAPTRLAHVLATDIAA